MYYFFSNFKEINENYDFHILQIDVELAKTCAKQMVKPNENEYDFLPPNSTKPKFSVDMRRKVWLQIGMLYVVIKFDIHI